MPRVNRVKSAQQRYATKPDLDEDGNQKVVPVFKRDGVTPKTNKRGEQVTRRLTVRDLTKPLPMPRCDFGECEDREIKPGQAYKFLDLRFGKKYRHAEHPDWQHWEYSDSVAAQCHRLQRDMHASIDSWKPTAESDLDDMATELQGEAESFLNDREAALDNMPEALQEGSQAQEFLDLAQEWVDAFDSVDAPTADFAADCEDCDGGQVDNLDYDPDDEDSDEEEYVDCEACDGTGELIDVPSDEWIEEAKDALRALVDEAQF